MNPVIWDERLKRFWISSLVVVAVAAGIAQAQTGGAADEREQCRPCPDNCQLPPDCRELTPLRVKLRWIKSAQFAGFYAAEALGYWKEECLDVSLGAASYHSNAVEFWDMPPSEIPPQITIPHYQEYLSYAVEQERDVFHVGQYFRRPGYRWWTSPVNQPERTAGITSYADLEDVEQCIRCDADCVLDATTYSLLQKHNETACNYVDPRTKEKIDCVGGESVRFVSCGFGIEELMGRSETSGPAHVMQGMVYDQLGQMLSTVANGSLLEEHKDFLVFSPAEDGIHNLEDGLMVNRTWLDEPENEETLIRFLKGLHKGWIYCREHPFDCAQLVSPDGPPSMQLHQRYQMHEVNKLIWPAPGGIGIHPPEGLNSSQESALRSGLISRTVPFKSHTSDEYARVANERLTKDGYDVEGAFFTQPAFQRRLAFCLDENMLVFLCESEKANSTIPGNPQDSASARDYRVIVISVTVVLALALAICLLCLGMWWRHKYIHSAAYRTALMRRNPPGLLGTDRPVTIVVTDIEGSTSLWNRFPEEMVAAQSFHDKCLRECLHKYSGYEVHTEGDSFTVAFHEADDALKWCCTVQMELNNGNWPEALRGLDDGCARRSSEEQGALRSRPSMRRLLSTRRGSPDLNSKRRKTLAPLANASPEIALEEFIALDMEDSTDRGAGRRHHQGLFTGLRVRMGAHTGSMKEVRRHALTNRVIYDKDLVNKAKLVSEAGHGGQIVLTSDTLADIDAPEKFSEVGFILHMGMHLLQYSQASLKSQVEVVLPVLDEGAVGQSSNRPSRSSAFSSSKSLVEGEHSELFTCLPLGLMSRNFAFPPLRTEEQLSPGYFDAPRKERITICFASVQHLDSLQAQMPAEADAAAETLCMCVRKHLSQYQGYECEELGTNFLVAFHTPQAAVKWALALQEALLVLDWSNEVLQHPSCQTWTMGNKVMFRGPRLQIGIASGSVLKKTPSTLTGRADYFGPLLNLAARIKSRAAGGQVLVNADAWKEVSEQDDALMGLDLGEMDLKGMGGGVHLFQITKKESHLSLRSYPMAYPQSAATDEDLVGSENKGSNLIRRATQQSASSALLSAAVAAASSEEQKRRRSSRTPLGDPESRPLGWLPPLTVDSSSGSVGSGLFGMMGRRQRLTTGASNSLNKSSSLASSRRRTTLTLFGHQAQVSPE